MMEQILILLMPGGPLYMQKTARIKFCEIQFRLHSVGSDVDEGLEGKDRNARK